MTLKYETLSWDNIKFGARFFAHGELYNDHDDSTTDPYEVDIETKFTLPEVYLNYGFLDSSSITVGRWNHEKVSHIDDAQSEGGYVSFKEIENLEFIAGVMTRFAEIDYDDSEDFGRTNNAQDLDSEDTYSAGFNPILIFLEARYQPIELLNINPYFMYNNDYASVFGSDTSILAEWEEHEMKYGGTIIYKHSDADITGSTDADIIVIQPFVQKGPVELKFSYSKFDDGDSLNHPGWLADSFNIVDQDAAKNNTGAEIFETRIKYAWDKAWISYAYAMATYDTSSTKEKAIQTMNFKLDTILQIIGTLMSDILL